MAASTGTVKVPALISIEAGDPSHQLATAAFELEFELTGSPRPIGADRLVVSPDGASMRASMAKALRQAADDIEAQG